MKRTQWLSTSLDTDNRSALRRPPSGQRRGPARRCPRRTLALVTTLALAVALVVLRPVAMAALQITAVSVDEASNTITILGQEFTGSGQLVVTLGTIPTTTLSCPPETVTPTSITCTLPILADGDYRL